MAVLGMYIYDIEGSLFLFFSIFPLLCAGGGWRKLGWGQREWELLMRFKSSCFTGNFVFELEEWELSIQL
jgi:hypothetical protein